MTDHERVECLIQQVTSYLAEWSASGSNEVIISDEAWAVADSSWSEVRAGTGLVPHDAAMMLGCFHYARFMLLPFESDTFDLEAAMTRVSRFEDGVPELARQLAEVGQQLNALASLADTRPR